MAANGIRIVELLGPGDPGHSDHWHVAFAAVRGAPASPAPWTVAVTTRALMTESAGRAPIVLAAAARGYDEGPVQMDGLEGDGPQPAWGGVEGGGGRGGGVGGGGGRP